MELVINIIITALINYGAYVLLSRWFQFNPVAWIVGGVIGFLIVNIANGTIHL